MAQQQKAADRKSVKNKIITTAVVCAILAVVAYVLVTFVFFKIETIQVVSVSGDSKVSDYYTADEIINASEIDIGDNMFRLSADKISAEIQQELPYIGSVTIKRKIPSTLNIVVEDTSPAYGIESNGSFILLNSNYKVLGIEDYLPQGAAKIVGVEFSSLDHGKTAVFADESDANRFRTLVDSCAQGGLTNITKYDIENIANINVVINSRITIIFGTMTDLTEKLSLALKTMNKELENNPDVHIIINITDSERSYVRNDTSPLEEDTVDYEEYSMRQETTDNLVAVG
ncbi:MAG: FtsQ-type POTRA domain-containing protein [Clostridia bacterium]|nr:FtsQ-type POTRA domain-containing protein [Clostridia bacterium]